MVPDPQAIHTVSPDGPARPARAPPAAALGALGHVIGAAMDRGRLQAQYGPERGARPRPHRIPGLLPDGAEDRLPRPNEGNGSRAEGPSIPLVRPVPVRGRDRRSAANRYSLGT